MTIGTETPPPPAASPATPAAAQPEPNPFARIFGVLAAPGRTFLEIARRPDIMVPLFLLLVIGYASTFAIAPRTDYDAMLEVQYEAMKKQNPNLSDADFERFGNITKTMTKVSMFAGPVLGIVMYVIVAALLLLAFRLMGGENDFKQTFSVTLYSMMPAVILSIVMTVVVLIKGTFNPITYQTLVKSNPAFLVDMKTQPVLFSLLASLDVFTIWTIVLLIIGMAAASKFSRAKSAAIIIPLWLVYVVIKLGMAALQGMGGKGA